MSGATPNRRPLSDSEKSAMRAYWNFYEPLATSISQELRAELLRHPFWAAIMRSLTPTQMDTQDARSRELQRAAILADDWQPYLDELYAQGEQYAKMGVSFFAWYEILAMYRDVVRRRLGEIAQHDVARATTIGDGMNCFLDVGMSHLGDAYLRAKERIITTQAASLRELSVPVLEVEERVLIAPLVGTVDSDRARELTERLLEAIRDRRALGVVLDITGVPVVDSNVANHIAQTAAAAKLMGASVIVTGMSPAIASTLAALGDPLTTVPCASALRDGIDNIRRIVADRVAWQQRAV